MSSPDRVRRSEEILRKLRLEAADVAALVVNDGKVIAANLLMRELTRSGLRELLGKDADFVILWEEGGDRKVPIYRRGKPPVEVRYWVAGSSGEIFVYYFQVPWALPRPKTMRWRRRIEAFKELLSSRGKIPDRVLRRLVPRICQDAVQRRPDLLQNSSAFR